MLFTPPQTPWAGKRMWTRFPVCSGRSFPPGKVAISHSAHIQYCGRIVGGSPLDDLRPQRVRSAQSTPSVSQDQKGPQGSSRWQHTPLHNPSQLLPKEDADHSRHCPPARVDVATGRGPGRCHQVRDFLALALLPLLELSSNPVALQCSWGLGIDLAHLPRDPGTHVPEHLCLQRDRD